MSGSPSAGAQQLQRAIQAVFAEWTALNLAVENDWGGRDTRDKALALLARVTAGLQPVQKAVPRGLRADPALPLTPLAVPFIPQAC